MALLGRKFRWRLCCAITVSIGVTSCTEEAWDTNPSTTAFEVVPAGEADAIAQTVDVGVVLQDLRAKNDPGQEGQLLRGVHAKSHGCVKAEFAIRDDIDDKYRVGLFAHRNRVHEAWIRFSNAAALREDDLKPAKSGVPETRENGSRGMAIKVMDVEGDMLDKDHGRSNQDFLMINTPAFAFANVGDYLRLNRILERSDKGDDPKPYFFPAILAGSKQALAALGEPAADEPAELVAKRRELQGTIDFLSNAVEGDPLLNSLSDDELKGTFDSASVVELIKGETVRNPMQVQYFGAAPFLFGEGQAMKFSAAPCKEITQAQFAETTADDPSKDYLREALAETMKGNEDVCYDFKIQTRDTNDIAELNIEDATTTWPDEEISYVDVARITIKAPQSPHTKEALEQCEALAFNPWHSLAAHQPLGGINRLRRDVYFGSAGHRGAESK